MSTLDINEVKRLAKGYALYNAVKHGGKAALGPVMGKIMAEKPEWRPYAKEIVPIVKKIIDEVNSLPLSEQKRLLESEYKWIIESREKREETRKTLPPLPNAEEGKVVTRFAPNPDFVIHLGNARPAILSYEYARMYKGRMILRFEDTDPRIKAPIPEAYELIREDLRWLGIHWDEEYIQSLRMKIYYDIARELISKGGAYVDTLPTKEFKKYRDEGALEKYPPRLRDANENLELWDKMLEGYFSEGEAVLRVKTDPNHPDPSIRDWVAFRIIDTEKYPHPITGSKYIVWPTYNFAAGVDDHLMGVTHILRAREHMQNTIKQQYMYRHLGWKYPTVIHFGRLNLEGLIMSKSSMKSILEEEKTVRLDDPRFATIAGLRRRGIHPEAIRRIIIDVGLKQTDATISFKNLAAYNRSIVDAVTPRIMFVNDPVPLIVKEIPWNRRTFQIPLHPNGKLGYRNIDISGPSETFYIARSDAVKIKQGDFIRLMELFNIVIESLEKDRVIARYHSLDVEEVRSRGGTIIHWVKADNCLTAEIVKPMGLEIHVEKGLIEDYATKLREGDLVQLVRYGFARVDLKQDKKIKLIYAHE